jgi:hypothetical protein
LIKKGGFHFKETVITEDRLERSAELKKVLGLEWDLRRKKYDVNISSREKKKGAYKEDNADLSC